MSYGDRKTVSGNLPAELAERMSDQSLSPPDYEARRERTDRIMRRAAQYLSPQSSAHEVLYDLGDELVRLVLELHAEGVEDARIGREARAWATATAARLAAREEP